jgi:hypothetical protein
MQAEQDAMTRTLTPPAAHSRIAGVQWQDVIRNLRHPDAKVRLTAVDNLDVGGDGVRPPDDVRRGGLR